MKYNLKPLVNQNIYQDFLAYLDERINKLYVSMSFQDDIVEIRKLQGAIRELNRLKKLREIVNGKG